jgi:hypothetical protein
MTARLNKENAGPTTLVQLRSMAGNHSRTGLSLVRVWLFALSLVTVSAAPVTLLDRPADGAFPLVGGKFAADLVTDPADFKVVQIAAQCLAEDVRRVTGRQPRLGLAVSNGISENAVIIGTIGKSPVIDALIKAGRLDVRAIRDKWESFVIATVRNPLPGVTNGLVIAGSDRRGTAFGVFELSETIGVSPWVWWADVAPFHRDSLFIGAGANVQGPPSVKYRGIFINDEDWGLQPWAAKTFEPELGDIGPKTYAKVCELLLRLKANYLWPAMHPCTKAFNIYPENKLVADDYAIVMGSSHAEPMLRNNVTEWDIKKYGAWDYEANRDSLLNYWETRVKENGRFENTYTLGLRGIHDSAMPGGGTTAEKVARLQRVIGDQREMLARDVNPKVEQVPQIFVPYKEVLPLYQNGLQVPDDVTLVWVDDNHGYIRQLSTPDEQKRPGGAGVYYHVSYWGAPADYLWLCTTPPALIWEEMRKAYDYGAHTVWVLNVGDIKPAEIDMEFFLRMAWNIGPWNENAQQTFLTEWAGRNFGPQHAAEIAALMDEYYRLNYPAKPEHLLSARFTGNYGEKEQRLQRFEQLVKRTDALFAALPPEIKDAFYELVVYPVRCSALMNEKFLNSSPEKALAAYEQIQAETKYYNEQIAGGKWRRMMSANPRKQPVFERPQSGAISNSAPGVVADSGYISFEAEHPTRNSGQEGADWKVIAGLGRSGDSIALLPATAKVTGKAALEYDFAIPKSADARLLVYCIPTHSLNPGMKLRYAVSIDGQPSKIVDLQAKEFSSVWSTNVLRGAAIGTSENTLGAGKHTLQLRPLDPGLVFDKIVIDLSGLESSQLGPPESR